MSKFYISLTLLILLIKISLLQAKNKDVISFSKGTLSLNSTESINIGDLVYFEGNHFLVVDNETIREYINNERDLSKVITSRVTDMSFLFYKKTGFLGDISTWDTSNVTTMSKMFCWSGDLNPNVANWDTSNVTDFGDMFRGNKSFNQNISHWNVSKGTSFAGMFHDSNFNQNINNWDVSNAIDMSGMFDDASYFNHPLDKWNVSNVQNMGGMFAEAINFNQDISKWNVSNVKIMRNMFRNAASFNQNLSSWNVKNIKDVPADFSLNANFIEPVWEKNNLNPFITAFAILLLSSLIFTLYTRFPFKNYDSDIDRLKMYLNEINKSNLTKDELDKHLDIKDKSLDSQKGIRAAYIKKMNTFSNISITRKRSKIDSRTYLYEVKIK